MLFCFGGHFQCLFYRRFVRISFRRRSSQEFISFAGPSSRLFFTSGLFFFGFSVRIQRRSILIVFADSKRILDRPILLLIQFVVLMCVRGSARREKDCNKSFIHGSLNCLGSSFPSPTHVRFAILEKFVKLFLLSSLVIIDFVGQSRSISTQLPFDFLFRQSAEEIKLNIKINQSNLGDLEACRKTYPRSSNSSRYSRHLISIFRFR